MFKEIINISKRQKAIDFIKSQSVVRPKDMVELGLPKDYLYQFAQEGIIERIGHGLYQWPDQNVTQWQSWLEVSKRAPKGAICLLSALIYHDLTTQNPFEVWLAIDRKAWRSKISYPPVRFISMSGAAMEEGVEVHTIDGVELRVFCAAKTIADCFKYRNKIGLDVAIEALREGWRENKFNIDELMHYSEVCRVAKVIKPYADAIVAEG